MDKKAKQRLTKAFERDRALNTLAQPGAHEFILVLDRLKPDFNIGKIFRTADAFGANEVIIINTPFFDVSSAKGSFRHVHTQFVSDFPECYKILKERNYDIFVMEPEKGQDLHKTNFQKKSAFVLGHEEYGISFNPDDFEGIKRMRIPQFGKVQSLNVSIAAAVVMYEYLRQNPG